MATRRQDTKLREEITLIVTDKDGKVKQVEVVGSIKGMRTAGKGLHFCADCGEQLNEVPLYICSVCGERYVARMEPQTGKTIILALGKLEEAPAEMKGTSETQTVYT